MGFSVQQGDLKKIIADRNLYVIKTGSDILNGKYMDGLFFLSLHENYLYGKEVKQPAIKLNPILNNIFFSIREGYHSYFSVKISPDRDAVGLFMIPEGAILYKDMIDGEVVSSEIIFISKFNKDTISTDSKGQIVAKEWETDNRGYKWYVVKNQLFPNLKSDITEKADIKAINLSDNVRIEKTNKYYRIKIFDNGNLKTDTGFICKEEIGFISKTIKTDADKIKYEIIFETKEGVFRGAEEIEAISNIDERDIDLIMKFFKKEFKNEIKKLKKKE